MKHQRLQSMLITITVIIFLYLSGPGSAILVSLLPGGPYNLGRTATFQATVDIRSQEIIPINSVNLTITKPDNQTITCTLPYNTPTTQTIHCSGGQNITVIVKPATTWYYGLGYAYGYGFGYGYGYDEYVGYGYYWGSGTSGFGGYGYGYLPTYGYGTSLGRIPTQINYTINWAIPSLYDLGVYSIKITVHAAENVEFNSQLKEFTVYPGGVKTPYAVYGYLNYTNGSHPRNLKIQLTNYNSSETLNLSSIGSAYDNSTGFFQFEASNLPNGYIDTDLLQLDVNITNGKWLQKRGVVDTSLGSTNLGTIVITDVVISEILPNPLGDDDALKPYGEWIELNNKDNESSISVEGWNISDSDNNKITITSARVTTNTTLSAGGWLAVYRNGDSYFTLNDDADTITLIDNTGVIQDMVSYNLTDFTNNITSIEGWSIAIQEDGEWNVTEFPTPNAPPGRTKEINLSQGWNLLSLPLYAI